MTEEEWLHGTDPEAMLAALRGKMSDRKMRLFAVACCRRVLPLLADVRVDDERLTEAIDRAEDYADGVLGDSDLQDAGDAAVEGWWEAESDFQDHPFTAAMKAAACCASPAPADAAIPAAAVVTYLPGPEWEDAWRAERAAQCAILRDLVGPALLSQSTPGLGELAWDDYTVVELAEAIYRDRAFDRLPILADALEEAGGSSADLLGHLRGPGPHVRGCWAVDLILGKE